MSLAMSLSRCEARNRFIGDTQERFLLPPPPPCFRHLSSRSRAKFQRVSVARETKNSERVCSLELLSTRYKAAMGYRLGRRLMIPLVAVFAGILQHSHSTGFRSGATARIISRPRSGAPHRSRVQDRVQCRPQDISTAPSKIAPCAAS